VSSLTRAGFTARIINLCDDFELTSTTSTDQVVAWLTHIFTSAPLLSIIAAISHVSDPYTRQLLSLPVVKRIEEVERGGAVRTLWHMSYSPDTEPVLKVAIRKVLLLIGRGCAGSTRMKVSAPDDHWSKCTLFIKY
jgi:hypothetical protein